MMGSCAQAQGSSRFDLLEVYVLLSIRTGQYQLIWSLDGVMQSVCPLVGCDIMDNPHYVSGFSYSCQLQAYLVEYLGYPVETSPLLGQL